MKLTVCGDVCFKDVDASIRNKNIDVLFRDVPELLKQSDRVIVNLECALTEVDTPIKKIGPNLKSAPATAEVLKMIGVTDCNVCNNHIFDYGVSGVEDTIKAVTEAGLTYTGFGKNYEDSRKPLILEKDGVSVAVISVCEHEYCYAVGKRMGARPFVLYDTLEDIKKAKTHCDYVIVLYHGGKEQSIYPSPRLRRQSQEMVECGADVILCQHSHCIGSYEKYQNGHILYGQGNFNFIMNSSMNHPHWQNGVCLAQAADKEQILERLNMHSQNLLNGEWLNGWREFCEENREKYLKVIREAYGEHSSADTQEMFAHYFYCEAHHDVWRELCKLPWENEIT